MADFEKLWGRFSTKSRKFLTKSKKTFSNFFKNSSFLDEELFGFYETKLRNSELKLVSCFQFEDKIEHVFSLAEGNGWNLSIFCWEKKLVWQLNPRKRWLGKPVFFRNEKWKDSNRFLQLGWRHVFEFRGTWVYFLTFGSLLSWLIVETMCL